MPLIFEQSPNRMFPFTFCAMFVKNMNSHLNFLCDTQDFTDAEFPPFSTKRYLLNHFLVQIWIPLSLQKVWFRTGHFHLTGKDTVRKCIFNVCLWCQTVAGRNSLLVKLMSFVTTSIRDCSGCCSFEFFFFYFVCSVMCYLTNLNGVLLIFPSLALPLSHSLLNIHLFTLGQKIFISSSWAGCWSGDSGFANISDATSVTPLLHMKRTLQSLAVLFFVCSQFIQNIPLSVGESHRVWFMCYDVATPSQ